jgi:hypothetical protein
MKWEKFKNLWVCLPIYLRSRVMPDMPKLTRSSHITATTATDVAVLCRITCTQQPSVKDVPRITRDTTGSELNCNIFHCTLWRGLHFLNPFCLFCETPVFLQKGDRFCNVCDSWMNVYGALVWWCWWRKIEILGEKPVPVKLCRPQISHGPAWDRNWTSKVRGRWLTYNEI